MKKLTEHDLVETVYILAKGYIREFRRQPDAGFLTFGLACEVLRIYLGNEWTNESGFSMHKDVSDKNRSDRGYLKTESIETTDQYRHQQRVSDLAEHIYNLQNISGIERKIESIQKDRLFPMMAEFECAAHLFQANIDFHFVLSPKKLKRGLDYDIEINLPDGDKIPCEVESKYESAVLRSQTILESLQNADDQLPAKIAGLCFLDKVLQITIQNFFTNAKQVVALIIFWQEAIDLNKEYMLFRNQYRYVLNNLTSEIQELLERLKTAPNLLDNKHWTSFRHIVSKFLRKLPQLPENLKLLQI